MYIEKTNTVRIDNRNSAFPTIIKIGGDLICGFSVGGGPEATGGTDWSRSSDSGKNWSTGGTVLPATPDGKYLWTNTLRLSKAANNKIIAYGQRILIDKDKNKFGENKTEPVFCISNDECRTWSNIQKIPNSYSCSVEASNPIVVLSDGRWLAPAGLLTSPERLGEKVIAWESCNEGKTWENEFTVFSDPKNEKGFFEQKIIETEPGKLIAFAWTVKLPGYEDLTNHFSISENGGRTWSPPYSMPIYGQTMNPLWLGNNEYLLIYNYRKSPPGIRLAHVNIENGRCEIFSDEYLWRPESGNTRQINSAENGIDLFDDFKFGLPSICHISGDSYAAVFWCKEGDFFGVRYINMKLDLKKEVKK